MKQETKEKMLKVGGVVESVSEKSPSWLKRLAERALIGAMIYAIVVSAYQLMTAKAQVDVESLQVEYNKRQENVKIIRKGIANLRKMADEREKTDLVSAEQKLNKSWRNLVKGKLEQCYSNKCDGERIRELEKKIGYKINSNLMK